MNDDELLRRQRHRAQEKLTPVAQYTAKDFQLEVLDKLAEMQALAESLHASWKNELTTLQGQRLLRLDGRTLVAFGAVALSIAGYVLQDARNTSRQDTEIETTKARVARLEQIAATNTEGRIRMEVELGELRTGQGEIKRLIEAHDNHARESSREGRRGKTESGGGGSEHDSR